MDRRSFTATVIAGLATLPRAAHAQPSTKVVKVGVLRAAPDSSVFRRNFDRFRQALQQGGFVDGTNLALEYRIRAGTTEEIAGRAGELLRLRMDAILAVGPAAVRAATSATKSIPIVAVDLESDPVGEGFVTGLARPGRNVTGLFLDFPGVSGKWIELLREMVPRLSLICVTWDPATPPNLLRGAEDAARTMRVRILAQEARGAEGLAAAFRLASARRAGAMLMLPSTMINSARQDIIALAVKHRIATIMAFPEFAEEGGLIAYGPNVADMFHQAGNVMVKVLRGVGPGEIPIERPARFEMIVNRKTATSLGLVVSRPLLARADKVIE